MAAKQGGQLNQNQIQGNRAVQGSRMAPANPAAGVANRAATANRAVPVNGATVTHRTTVTNRGVTTSRSAAINRGGVTNRAAVITHQGGPNRAMVIGRSQAGAQLPSIAERRGGPRNLDWGRSHGWSQRGGYWYRDGRRTNFVVIAGAYPWAYDDYTAYYAPYGAWPYGQIQRQAPVIVGESTAAEVQSALKQNGYYSGPVDGIIGPMSRSAISAFQRSNGLPVTGNIDQGLLSSLGL